MTHKCSDAALPTDRRFATSQISPRTATPNRGIYLWLNLLTGGYKFSGATIRWTEI